VRDLEVCTRLANLVIATLTRTALELLERAMKADEEHVEVFERK
jgi:hypothetical protein